jgi:hypothetical protein
VTAESKYLIDLTDIIGFEYECHACKGKVTVGGDCRRTVFTECPLCNANWVDVHTQEEQNIREFVNSLRTAVGSLQGRGFTLKLQIAVPITPSATAGRT